MPPFTLSRRELLAALAALAACGPTPPAPRTPRVGELLPGLAARGHRLREAPPPPSGAWPGVDVLIVGAGVAGLSAAWRLAGRGLDLAVLELAEVPGGTAASATGPHGPHPLGAHYVTLPSPEARAMRALLAELGVIEGQDAAGRPRYRETDLCFAPEERLHVAGEWIEGLWPALGATPEDEAQRAAWEALVEDLTARVGADGRPAFAIPVAASSHDPALRALAGMRFSDWLDARGFTSPRLRWLLEYGTRDDFGADLSETSAWAGLHYHCARRPDPADAPGTQVLTWPGGNGWLVEQLAARVEGPLHTGALVHRVEPEGAGVRALVERAGEAAWQPARHAILAVPAYVADRLVDRPPGPRPAHTPWRVVALHCDEAPAGRGVRVAWDSVVYGAPGLGYVSNAHQRATYGGPTTLSWYEPLSGQDPAEARRALVAAPPAACAARALDALSGAHPDLLERLQAVEVMRWGHGTARPAPGLHLDPLGGPLALAARGLPGVSFAHTDLSGMSLFEEAQWHGVRAAEEALAALGLPPGESLL